MIKCEGFDKGFVFSKSDGPRRSWLFFLVGLNVLCTYEG
jgi:hypothetical protein